MTSPRYISASRLALSVALIAAAFSAGCRKHEASSVAEALPSAAVRVAVVEQKARPSSEEVVGTVRAKLRAAIEAKVSGRIEALLVAPGQTVKAGELIAQLDAREIQAKLDQALAMREQATRDLARARELDGKEDHDAGGVRLCASAGARRRRLGQRNGDDARLHQAHRALQRHRHPQARRVGDLATPGKPIIEMEDPSALRFEADVPEALIGNVKLGAKLPVRVGAVPTPIEGIVVEMAPVADAASRTFS